MRPRGLRGRFVRTRDWGSIKSWIINTYLSGSSLYEVAKLAGISKSTINFYLNKWGIKKHPSGNWPGSYAGRKLCKEF